MSTPQTAASSSVKRCKQIGVHTKQKKSKKKPLEETKTYVDLFECPRSTNAAIYIDNFDMEEIKS
jgi:hypothetical protein